MDPIGYQRYHNAPADKHILNTAIKQDTGAHTQSYYPNVSCMYADRSNKDDLG